MSSLLTIYFHFCNKATKTIIIICVQRADRIRISYNLYLYMNRRRDFIQAFTKSNFYFVGAVVAQYTTYGMVYMCDLFASKNYANRFWNINCCGLRKKKDDFDLLILLFSRFTTREMKLFSNTFASFRAR